MLIFALPFVVVVHRCTHWGTRHEVLASPGLILSDWASDPCYFQEEILSNSTDKRFWTQNSWSDFPVQMKTMHRVSPKLSDLQMTETSNFLFDRLECVVHIPLSPAWPLLRFPRSFLGIQWWSQNFFVTLHLRDQSLQCFPRDRRNASAIGSRTSVIF